MTVATNTLTERRSTLSDAKRDLLERRLRGQTPVTGAATPAIRRAERGATVPLSSAQQRMWFFGELEPGSAVYNIPYALRLQGPLEVAALRAALEAVAARHEMLRTRFVAQAGEPVQVIGEPSLFAWAEHDLSAAAPSGAPREAALRKFLHEESRRPFDLASGPTARATLVRLEANDAVLVIVMHHIMSDLSSWTVFWRELTALYESQLSGKPARLPELTIQYADYAVWERASLASPAVAQQRAYWAQKLADAPPLLELPTDRPRPATMSFRGALARRTVPSTLAKDLDVLSRREGVTLFVTLLAAFKVLLFRNTQQPDVIVGIPTAGRTQAQTEPLIGLFVNTLALRSDLAGDPVFSRLLKQVMTTNLEALFNQDLPFDKLVEELRPLRGPGYLPLVQVMFTLQAAAGEQAHLSGVTVKPVEVDPGTARFDLTLVAEQTADGLDLVLEYNTDLYEEATAHRVLHQFQILLEGIVADPDQPISQLPLLSAAERHRLLVEWNDTRLDVALDRGIHQLFESQVDASPHALALIAGDTRLTYLELDERANAVANRLRARGVTRETRVAIFVRRSADMIVAMLGVLKAGGAYVAMDPAYPKDRLAYILRDSRAEVVVTQRSLQASLPGETANVLFVDDTAPAAAGEMPVLKSSANHDLAYVIYTSGSTGQPKGVAIEHRNAVAFIRWAQTVFSPRELDGVLAGTSICFDLSIFEIFVPLSCGGKIILAENALALPGLAAANEVRLLNTVPSVMAELLRLGSLPKSVEIVNLAGEALSQHLVQQLYAIPTIRRVYDLYGPTETTTYSTFGPREPQGRPTIGRPLANTEIYLLDRHLQPVPIGAAGEIFIGGLGVTRGYLDRPELTAERYVANPFSSDPEARLYRTGDLGRYRTDGRLEYLGRLDQQIKIRGFRIELGEIETALRAHPAVTDTVVVAREDTPGERRLVAYVVAAPGTADGAGLRAFLQRTLPEAMIPSAFVVASSFPHTTNGKIDRRALPAPNAEAGDARAYVAPRDALETEIAKLWAAVLGLPRVSVTDTFFDLGGHSLLAVRLAAQLEKNLDRRLPVAALFQAPSVAQLAALLRRQDQAAAPQNLIPVQPKGTQPPLFLAHGMGGGNIWGYANLARALGDDQPVYAFKPCEPERAADFPTIEAMAAHYVAELRRFQPQGPYRIGGYCFGGNIAFEMARQLEAQGERVGMLILLNAWPANAGHDRLRYTPVALWKFARNVYYWSTRWWQWTPRTRRQFVAWKFRLLRTKLARTWQPPEPADRQDIDRFVDLSDVTPGERPLWDAHLKALGNYHPKPYGGRVTLLRTEGYAFFSSFDYAHGWRQFARDGVDVRIVPGMHETLLIEPHVKGLARELRGRLATA